MGRFLIVLVVVAAIVAGVLYYTGYDVIGNLTEDVKIRELLPPRSWTANIAAGVISGLIVALISKMFSRG
jgi:hypothetical protein